MILGEAPAPGGDPGRPWDNVTNAGRRLWRWFRVSTYDELRTLAILRNVYDNAVHPSSPDDDRKTRLVVEAQAHDLIFLVGRHAQRLFKIDANCLIAVRAWYKGRYLVALPHPSGLNRELNGVSDTRMQMLVDFVRETFG